MAEYDQYVASRDIHYPLSNVGGLAYRHGDPVPASNVALHDYDALGLVTPTTGPVVLGTFAPGDFDLLAFA